MLENQWTVYILRLKNGSLYTGITKNLERRLEEHRTSRKGSKYVRARLPFEVAYVGWGGNSRSWAQSMEAKIKSMSHEEKEDLCKFYEIIKNFRDGKN